MSINELSKILVGCENLKKVILGIREWVKNLDFSQKILYNEYMININDNIKKNLIYLRKSRKLTQMDLAEQVGYSDKTVSKWETGESVPNVETLCRLAEFYEVSLDFIVKSEMEDLKQNTEHVKKSRYNKVVITLLAISAVWILFVSMYLYCKIVEVQNHWLMFIWPVPLSCIIALIFNSIWGNRRANYLIISVLMWTLLCAVYLSILVFSGFRHNIPMLFILGAPIQIAIILWSGIKRVEHRQKRSAIIERDDE